MKAGYSYSVFHGMMGKLTMASGSVTSEPCPECGMWSTHRMECSKRKDVVFNSEMLKKEMEQTKEALSEIDISKLFNEAIGQTVIS